ncbi:MAG: glycosyltransferase, partial [Betaproteobacteria bacterium]|nr:glycosyltransferase [Betaproteobacteria bacterium]
HGRPSLSRRSSFLQLHRLGGVRVTEYRATIPCDIHGDFEIFSPGPYNCATVPDRKPHLPTDDPSEQDSLSGAGPDELRGRITRLQQELRERDVQITALQERIAALLDSTSWKITWPLRMLRETAEGIPRRILRRLRSYWRGEAARVAPELAAEVETGTDRFVPLTTEGPPADVPARLVCFYLPQFHAIPENDAWWGDGFTEWSKVRPARPLFHGHYQPHVPGELGYYNLLSTSVQRRQVELARLYGIGAFAFYFYWFGGKRLLEGPLENYLADGSLDLPFCLCWANESWSRRWDGRDQEVLIAQKHSPSDDLAFIEHIARYLRDPRYLRIDGRPVILVYRPGLLPSASETAQRWRAWCAAHGIGPIYLAYTQSFDRVDPAQYGFDAAIEFPPNNSTPPEITAEIPFDDSNFTGKVFDWRIFPTRSENYASPGYRLYRTVCPRWDNTPRRGSAGTVFLHSSPRLYKRWLVNAIKRTVADAAKPDERLVFVNAWNEWAEGAHLEPDARFGYAWLQATRDALDGVAVDPDEKAILIVSHDAHPHGAQFQVLSMARQLRDMGMRPYILSLGTGPLLEDFAAAAETAEALRLGAEGTANWLAQLRAKGVFQAIANTTVSGPVVGQLKRLGFRVVGLIHELPGVLRHMNLERAAQEMARHADALVFPATLVRERFVEIAPVADAKCLIRPQGLLRRNPWVNRRAEAKKIVCRRFGWPEDAKIVLGVGYLDPRKGADLLVEAAANLVKDRSDVRFAWVGHAEKPFEAQVRRRIDSLGLNDHFCLAGFERDPMPFYAAASVYALVSREDPFPNVVTEAASAGIPVVAFEGTTGAAEFILAHGGRLARHLDPLDFAVQLRALLDRPPAQEAGAVGSMQTYLLDLMHATSGCARVSVIVPSFNYEKHIRERLRSVMAQEYPIYELIVLDDASRDASVSVIRDALEEAPCDSRLIVNPANSGSAFRQWEKGLRACTGDLVWIAEADDLAEPGLLDELVPCFRDPEIVLAYCQSRQIDAQGREIAPDYLDYTKDVSRKWRDSYVASGMDEIRDCMTIKNTIPSVSAALFRRTALVRAFESAGARLFDFKVAGDWLLYLEVLKQGRMVFRNRSLNLHRRHDASITQALAAKQHLEEVRQLQRLAMSLSQPSEDVALRAGRYLEHVRSYLGIDGEISAARRDADASTLTRAI